MDKNKEQEKSDPEETVLALNSGEIKKYKGKLFKSKCNKCEKYGHRESDFWGNDNNKHENNKGNPSFNEECNNCGKKAPSAVDCWSKKRNKEDDSDNLFMEDTFYGKISKIKTKKN